MDYGTLKWDIIYWWSDISQNYDTADYVPSIWANDNKTEYKFPAGQKMTDHRKRHLIHNCNELNEGEFTWCKAVCKKLGVRDLKEAQAVLKRAQCTSNLESDAATSEDENFEVKTPSAKRMKTSMAYKRPIFNQPRGSLNVTDRVNSCSPTIINLSALGPSSQPTPHSLNSSSRLPFSYDTNSRAAHTTLQYNAQSVLSENESENKIFHDLQPARSIASLPSQANMQVQDVHVQQFADIASKIVQAEIQKSHQRLEDIIVLGLNGLSEKFGQIAYEVRELNRKYDEVILHSNGDRHNHLRENITSEMRSLFPLKTIDDMNDFERQLQDAEMMEALVNMLFLCGGETYHKGIYTYMKKMFHPELASLYSGQGKKNKLNFSSLNVYKAITDAVRRRFDTVTDREVMGSVSQFLFTIKDRLKNKN